MWGLVIERGFGICLLKRSTLGSPFVKIFVAAGATITQFLPWLKALCHSKFFDKFEVSVILLCHYHIRYRLIVQKWLSQVRLLPT